MIGQTLGHYRITAAIGAGGMGEVFRATDANLGREVAIKVLPPEVARDPSRLGRFRREAHLLASLNHPNIASIYGLEECDGSPFLALELVEGEDLKSRLARGAIPVEEALEIAEQIAEALEEAHDKGIVHRDLKPANVKLTPGGKVKVLDFGLAKAWVGESPDAGWSSSEVSESPTLARTGTVVGLILGTAAYMSPEQARGKPVDRRTDVWAFGVLLWEMLTGRALFTGDTITDVIAAVVTMAPDLDALPGATPRAVRRLLARCLRKDPRARLPDIGAARLELQDVIAGTSAEAEPTVTVTDSGEAKRERLGRRRERWAWIVVALVMSGLVAALAFLYLRRAPERTPAARFAVEAPSGWSFSDLAWPVPSPDGRQVVFVARPDSPVGAPAMLWTRPLDSLIARPLAGTEGVEQGIPVWSPDGRQLAFFAGGELRRLSLVDGTVERICAMPGPGNTGADWSKEGTILFSAGGFTGRIYSVPATGGDARPVTTLDASRGETSHHVPQFLPDGRFLFLVAAAREESVGLYVASLQAPDERRQVSRGWLHYAYAAGRLLFSWGGTLFAQPFDAARAERSGEPVAIASSVAAGTLVPGLGWFGVSPAGTIASFGAQNTGGRMQLTWLDRKGQKIAALATPGDFGQITLSPDGRTLALEIRDAATQADLWVMDVQRGVASRVTATPADEYDPVWSPDGRSIAFAATRPDGIDMRRKGLRAGDPETVLARLPDEEYPESWSRDGRTLLFCRRTVQDKKSIWALSVADGKVVSIVDNGFAVDEPQLSPDGRWLAYISADSGRYEVYLEPFRGDGSRVRVSADGGGQPKWRADGRELFFTTPANRLTAVSVPTAGGRLDVGHPTGLFELRDVDPIRDHYAVSADGLRFLVKLPVDEVRKPQIHVITRWTSPQR